MSGREPENVETVTAVYAECFTYDEESHCGQETKNDFDNRGGKHGYG